MTAEAPCPPSATNLIFGISEGRPQLVGPTGHTGWQLRAQTNEAGAGLGTNWAAIAGSTEVNQFRIPMDAGNGSGFFRLVYP